MLTLLLCLVSFLTVFTLLKEQDCDYGHQITYLTVISIKKTNKMFTDLENNASSRIIPAF